jgi:hypothetical protein
LWLSPLWRGPGPLFEQKWILFTKGKFVLSLIEFGWLVLEKKIFKNFQCIFTLSLLSPLGEGQSHSFEQTWNPSPKRWSVPSMVKNWPSGSGEEVENSKVYRRTDRRTDGWMDQQTIVDSSIRIAHLSFQLRWAKKPMGQTEEWTKNKLRSPSVLKPYGDY